MIYVSYISGMKTKIINYSQETHSKLIDEAARQQMLINQPVNVSDLIRFYIEKGLNEKPRVK